MHLNCLHSLGRQSQLGHAAAMITVPCQNNHLWMIVIILQALEIMTEQQTDDPTALPIFYNAEDKQFYEL